jgi:hypothetical protein
MSPTVLGAMVVSASPSAGRNSSLVPRARAPFVRCLVASHRPAVFLIDASLSDPLLPGFGPYKDLLLLNINGSFLKFNSGHDGNIGPSLALLSFQERSLRKSISIETQEYFAYNQYDRRKARARQVSEGMWSALKERHQS